MVSVGLLYPHLNVTILRFRDTHDGLVLKRLEKLQRGEGKVCAWKVSR